MTLHNPSFDATPRAGSITLRQPELLASHWIVITTVAPPTADVMFMASLPGWKVVVIGDEKTPASWRYPNCVYLSLAEQRTLGFNLVDRLPVHSYSRKNLGYLYAIRHGAKVIFDTDDDNRPLNNLTSFLTSPTTSGLFMNHPNTSVFNPYPHFGQPTLWPRGFPLTAINDQRFNGTYKLCSDLVTPLIQQGVVKGDPDLDAIFRLTRKGTASVFNVTFDTIAPPVVLPAGTYSPFNSQNTLFLHGAFWALILPTTTAFRVCDIWRGYWAQRLLWEVGGTLGFPAVNARQSRNVHSYLEDALDETQMYFQTERLLDYLSSWLCPDDLSFFGCVERLSWDMASEDFWGKKDAKNIQLWLKDLLRLGYPEPKRVTPKSQIRKTPNCITSNETFSNNTQPSRVYFYSVVNESPSLAVLNADSRLSWTEGLYQMFKVCPELTTAPTSLQRADSVKNNFFHDVLLIIIFHYPFYSNLLYTEAAYRLAFPHIAYCGPDADLFLSYSHRVGLNLTFIEATVDKGKIGYVCLSKAIETGFHVDGYLVIGDDVLLNFWSFSKFNKTNIWMTTKSTRPLQTTQHIQWSWWSSPAGKKALLNASLELSRTKFPPGVTSLQKHKWMLQKNTGQPNAIFRSIVDTYYVPARFAPDVRWYLTLFLKHRVFVEIAVPMVLYGLQLRAEIETITGSSIWGRDRKHPWQFFNLTHQFLHPVKFSSKSSATNAPADRTTFEACRWVPILQVGGLGKVRVNCFPKAIATWHGRESNPRPPDLESDALTTPPRCP
ncbi:conserved uncharacterized protein [Elysia marginata]|uniref:Conserved uncharacterized protein n=1 Tax=Elysia marginata TaxID=1093978 RepID=A0AAV4FYJ4_9GAST|nr:conserved uncharacterized protein [Elysia marginata]